MERWLKLLLPGRAQFAPQGHRKTPLTYSMLWLGCCSQGHTHFSRFIDLCIYCLHSNLSLWWTARWSMVWRNGKREQRAQGTLPPWCNPSFLLPFPSFSSVPPEPGWFLCWLHHFKFPSQAPWLGSFELAGSQIGDYSTSRAYGS